MAAPEFIWKAPVRIMANLGENMNQVQKLAGETVAADPFDPAALRLDQSFADAVGVKKRLMTVPVRKPNRQDFVRVHPIPAYRLTPAAIIELKEDREVYLVTPNMAQDLPG